MSNHYSTDVKNYMKELTMTITRMNMSWIGSSFYYILKAALEHLSLQDL
jgi:hypothetical protein